MKFAINCLFALAAAMFIAGCGKPNTEQVEQVDAPSVALQETAQLSGLSVGASGFAQACMGIAAGDFDRNGFLDLAVTNFHAEEMNLFLQKSPRLFFDESIFRGLGAASKPMLGFGTQAADFDNDGWSDLAVLNGHLYDATYAGIEFRMRPQLLRGSASGFSQVDAEESEQADTSDYFAKPRLLTMLEKAWTDTCQG